MTSRLLRMFDTHMIMKLDVISKCFRTSPAFESGCSLLRYAGLLDLLLLFCYTRCFGLGYASCFDLLLLD